MNWEWIKKYYRKFKLSLFFRFSGIYLLKKILRPYSNLSYAQTGEDRIINELLKRVEVGFYVDVGAYHPVEFSNTILLYKKGWKGLNIDANEESIEKFNKFRSRDININAVVSNEVYNTEFVTFKDSAVSSIEKKNIEKWSGEKEIKNRKEIRTTTLQHLFENNEVPHKFDLLSVDVEGHDFEALTSFDLNIYKPTLIVIEMHDFDLDNLNQNKIYSYLTNNGYKFIGYIIMNGYFYRKKMLHE